MSKIALEKILTNLLLKEFPFIEKIHVSKTEGDFHYFGGKYEYDVFLGISPKNLNPDNNENIVKTVHTLSRFVLKPNQRVGTVSFFNPKEF